MPFKMPAPMEPAIRPMSVPRQRELRVEARKALLFVHGFVRPPRVAHSVRVFTKTDQVLAISGTSAPTRHDVSLDETSSKKASGNSHNEFKCSAINQQRIARRPAEMAMRIRRPFAERSMSGPSTGETRRRARS